MRLRAGDTTRRRLVRGGAGFLSGLVITLGVAWASYLGLEDRTRPASTTPLDLAAACTMRDGPTAVAYFAGSPSGWRCAWVVGDGWETQPISPREGCRLLHGDRAEAEPADPDSPFAWYCRP